LKKKTQILFIHGGETFKSQKDYLHFLKARSVSFESFDKWSDGYLTKKLGKDFEIARPRMPLQDNAKYVDWKIAFERYIPLLANDFILIGNSLGGIFLAKYLSENKLPKRALSTYLICPPFDDTLEGEDLVGGFKLKSDLSLISQNTKYLRLMFSKDDNVVPVSHAAKYAKKLPSADLIIYPSKNGHFRVSEFPEIIKMIKADTAK